MAALQPRRECVRQLPVQEARWAHRRRNDARSFAAVPQTWEGLPDGELDRLDVFSTGAFRTAAFCIRYLLAFMQVVKTDALQAV